MVNVTDNRLDPLFVLGILNSRLIRLFWLDRFYDQRRTFPKIKGTYLKQLPIVEPCRDKAKNQKLVRLVSKINEAYERAARAVTDRDRTYYDNRCAQLDKEIDALVYGLYDLTQGEIRVIEETLVRETE